MVVFTKLTPVLCLLFYSLSTTAITSVQPFGIVLGLSLFHVFPTHFAKRIRLSAVDTSPWWKFLLSCSIICGVSSFLLVLFASSSASRYDSGLILGKIFTRTIYSIHYKNTFLKLSNTDISAKVVSVRSFGRIEIRILGFGWYVWRWLDMIGQQAAGVTFHRIKVFGSSSKRCRTSLYGDKSSQELKSNYCAIGTNIQELELWLSLFWLLRWYDWWSLDTIGQKSCYF